MGKVVADVKEAEALILIMAGLCNVMILPRAHGSSRH